MNDSHNSSSGNRRRYHSDARTAKKEETRQHILDAVVAKMIEGDFRPVTMEEIAQAAGVGPATLYRHFPSREALWDGLSNEFNRRVDNNSTYARTPEDIAAILQRDFANFDQHPGLVQAFFLSELGRDARSRGRARRIASIREALAGVTSNISEPERTQAIAVIAYLASLQSWITMTSEFDLSGAQVGQAVAWAIQTLIASLEQNARSEKPDET